MTKKITILFHSGFGHTAKVAEFVTKGAASIEGVTAKAVSVEALTTDEAWAELDSSNAIIFGSPTYMGSVSGKFKQFMDDSSKRWFAQTWKNKIAAGFTNSGSLSGDKLNTLIQLSIFAAQQSMIWVGADLMPGKANDITALNRMGSSLGLMTQSENASPEVTPPPSDLETAILFGKRVAEITKKLG
jgi:NAD(P)H dehydrogenase (quinone)